MLTENELWLLSFYRHSEMSGALFFGRLAQSMKAGPIQHDMTQHFADESAHSWYWTQCIDQLHAKPLKLRGAYQDQYLEAAGMPVNVMEVLAITQVFEQRVIGQYAIHASAPNVAPQIRATLQKIMQDERWHIQWVRDALLTMEEKYGADLVHKTVRKFKDADREVYKHVLEEQSERIAEILKNGSNEPQPHEPGTAPNWARPELDSTWVNPDAA